MTEIGLVNTVDLGKLDVLLLEGSGCLLVVRGESLAVPAPRGKKLDEHQSLGLDDLIEVVGGKVDDVGRGDETSQREERGVREEVLDPLRWTSTGQGLSASAFRASCRARKARWRTLDVH